MKEQQIEVGDIVRYRTNSEMSKLLVIDIKDGRVHYENLSDGISQNSGIYDWMALGNATLVSKGNKGEIIGYETVVDLPGIPKGTKTEVYTRVSASFKISPGLYIPYYKAQLADTKFFKPIYKEKQIVVEISGDRLVGIKDQQIIMIDSVVLAKEAISFDQFIEVYNFITHKKYQSTKIKPYLIDILTFKLGCVELTREDMSKIYEAIAPQLKAE